MGRRYRRRYPGAVGMRVTGARLLERDRAIRLAADWDQPLPSHHDPFVVPRRPGPSLARRLVVDLAETTPGASLAVHVYPALSEGTASVVAEGAGRCRVSIPLAPSFASPGKAWVDLEDGTGEELWAEEIPVHGLATTVIDQLPSRFPDATVRGDLLSFGGLAELHRTYCRLGPRLGRVSVVLESPDIPDVQQAVGLVRRVAREVGRS